MPAVAWKIDPAEAEHAPLAGADRFCLVPYGTGHGRRGQVAIEVERLGTSPLCDVSAHRDRWASIEPGAHAQLIERVTSSPIAAMRDLGEGHRLHTIEVPANVLAHVGS